MLACLLVPPPAPPPWITLIRHSLPRPISSSHTLLLLPHPFSLLKLIQYHSGALHLVALKARSLTHSGRGSFIMHLSVTLKLNRSFIWTPGARFPQSWGRGCDVRPAPNPVDARPHGHLGDSGSGGGSVVACLLACSSSCSSTLDYINPPLSPPPHLLLSDSPPLTPPLLTSETYSVPQRCSAPCGT